MKKIFYGFLLIFLDFNINLGNSTLGLIPDFIGYIILVNGLTEMEGESPIFTQAKSISKFMIVISAIVYAIDLVGLRAYSYGIVYIALLLGLVSLAVGLYIGYLVIQAIKETEIRYNAFLNSRSLNNAWTVMAATDVATNVMLFIIPAVGVIAALCAFVAGICFLVQMNKSANFYINLKGGNNGTF